MKKYKLLVGTGLLSLPLCLLAQERVVTGKVLDAATGNPVAGAIVKANGANVSALTNEEGTYSLTLPKHVSSLKISSPDYNESMVGLKASEAQKVVKLYSPEFKADYTQSLKAGVDQTTGIDPYSNANNVKQELQDKLGAYAYNQTYSGAPGIGSVMFIQGLNSLNANAQPLVILDGVILEQQYGKELLHSGFFNDILTNVNPMDIESVSIIRNATALYGARGANGVILIETKRSHSMTTKITASASAGISMEPRYYEMMDAAQYRGYASELLKGTGTSITNFKFLNSDPNYYYYKQYHNETDWKEKVYREAMTQNYGINVEGGDDIAMYNLSVGFTSLEGNLECNEMNRLHIRFNSDINMTEKLKVKFDASFSNVTRNLRDDGAPLSYDEGTPSSPSFLAYAKSPFLSPYSYGNGELSKTVYDITDETYLDEVISAHGQYNYKLANPWALNHYAEAENKNHFENSLMNLTVTPIYKFNADWSLSEHFSYSLVNTNNKYYLPINGVPSFYSSNVNDRRENVVRSLASKQNSIFSDTRVDWNHVFGAHSIKAFAGARIQWETYTRNAQIGYNTGSDKTPFMSSGLMNAQSSGSNEPWRNIDYYMEGDYNYRNRYFAKVDFSASASSRFGNHVDGGLKMADVTWGLFPSIQAGWVITNETWAAGIQGLDYLRLTAGYDISGNDAIDNMAARSFFGASMYMKAISGLSIAGIGNPTIKWETTNRMNVGLQSSLIDNRLGVEFNYFNSKTKDLLSLQALGFLSGLPSNWGNAGELSNTGFDVTVTGKVIATKNWSWQVGASMGHYKNKIEQLADGKAYFDTEICGATIRTAVGNVANSFYGYQTAGVFASSEEAQAAGLYFMDENGVDRHYFAGGDMIFVDQNDDHIIDEKDRVMLGDPNPDFYGNITSKLSWKNFSLAVDFNYAVGNDAYNYMRSQLEGGNRFINQTKALTQRWQIEGQKTDVPKISFQDPMGNSRFSDRWIEDASYLRLKGVTLSYKLPLNMQFIQGLEFWVQGNNLYTWTKYLGSDPEFAATTNVIGQGIDLGLVGQSRSFVAGVKINL